VMATCDHSNKFLGYMKGEQFLEYMSTIIFARTLLLGIGYFVNYIVT
jgi:hypothetical protein